MTKRRPPRRTWDQVAGEPQPRPPSVCLLAPDGCEECMVEAGDPHRSADCIGNVEALDRLNGKIR